jgi:hypothetical protein
MGGKQTVIERGAGAAPQRRTGDVAWSPIRYDVDSVRRIGESAALWSVDGDLWEYEGGRFYLTELTGDGRRRWVADDRHVPPGPWRHYVDCVCEVCRLGSA